jgi:hypothetical protein
MRLPVGAKKSSVYVAVWPFASASATQRYVRTGGQTGSTLRKLKTTLMTHNGIGTLLLGSPVANFETVDLTTVNFKYLLRNSLW